MAQQEKRDPETVPTQRSRTMKPPVPKSSGTPRGQRGQAGGQQAIGGGDDRGAREVFREEPSERGEELGESDIISEESA